jgi:predicted kinase
MDPEEPAAAEYRAGIYSAEMTARTYQAMLNRAREQLLAGHSVILDATFLRRADRTAAAKLARETGAQFACILTRANEASVRKTMAARERSAGVSDARWDTYIQQKRRFQKPGEVPPNRLITLDVPAGRAGTKRVLKSLRALSPLSFPD